MVGKDLSRRRFMITAGTAAASAAMLNVQRAFAFVNGVPMQQDAGGTSIDWDNELNSYNDIYNNPPLLGRVIHTYLCQRTIGIFKGPSPDSGRIRAVAGDCGGFGGFIAPIYKAVHGEPYSNKWHSPIWFETNEGYMHSGHLIPCHEIFNLPEESFGTSGFWGEVTVPLGWQHRGPSFQSYKFDYDHYKSYWGQAHRILDRADDADGNAWYRIYDDVEPERQAWVLARTIRKVTVEDLAPISPDVTDKKITIDLGNQMITCYENGIAVFQTRIASGTSWQNEDGEVFDLSTPEGLYHVQRKRPSRRMKGGDDKGLDYDVNGVPFCTYFSFTGAAVHGAYWHNNFGLPRSHGCINVVPDAAKWIFRWSQPYLGYDEDYRWVQEGELATPIEIVL